MDSEQKAFFVKKLSEINENIRVIGSFVPVRCSPPSLNALNEISIAVLKLELEVEKWPHD